MASSTRKSRWRLVNTLIETFGFSPWLATAVALFLCMLLGAAVIWLWLSAPPKHLTITSGPAGSTFERYADAYRDALAEDHVTLKILPSAGSLENLRRLELGTNNVEIGFVQSGLAGDPPPPFLVSLGSVAYQPLFIFYRGAKIIQLSELVGKRIGVGPRGSGTNSLALALLEANSITGAPSTLVENAPATVAEDLLAGRLDAVFLMGDSAPTATLRALVRNPDVQLYHFAQAEAYVRRPQFQYLNKIVLPRGSFDLGKDLPPQDITLIGPTVELIANKKLNSALSVMLLNRAKEVHGKASVIAKKGEFPAPLDHGVPISDDALRFYKSGLGITVTLVGGNIWLASLINRVLVAIVPLMLLIIPTMRFLPIVYKWSVQLRIYRCYRPLLRLERDAKQKISGERAQDLLERLDEIEQEVNALKVPASFAYQFYALRGHVAFVRSRLKTAAAETAA